MENKFMKGMTNHAHHTYTQNGQYAVNTTDSKLVDFFGSVGALREASEDRIINLFEEAFTENPELALKTVFYARDVRGGLGERRIFKVLLKHLGNTRPEIIRPLLAYIPFYGRYDDLYALDETAIEDDMYQFMHLLFQRDINDYMADRKSEISLLAKWLKTADSKTEETKRLGIKTALKFKMPVRSYKRWYRTLRKHLKVVEQSMTKNEWNNIVYSHVPSKAMLQYRAAFKNHSPERFSEWVQSVIDGKAKVNASTLYPYELIEKLSKIDFDSMTIEFATMDDTELNLIRAQWDALPDYTGNGTQAIVMADTSGSMWGRPLYVSISLAMYFAQRNRGAFHGKWISFSGSPTIHEIVDDQVDKIYKNFNQLDWGYNTDIEKAFRLILDIGVDNHVPAQDMPKSLIIISDMEFDAATKGKALYYDHVKEMFEEHGYACPNIVFWNVNSNHNVFHVNSDVKGVKLASGSSPSVFTTLMESLESTPYEYMMRTLSNIRYDPITIG